MAVKHKIRDGIGGTKIVNLTAKRAIMAFCNECMGYHPYHVRGCTDKLCPLYPFRTHDPAKDSDIDSSISESPDEEEE